MDKNIREKDILKNWHDNISDTDNVYVFPQADDSESYFIKREEADYLTEYNFETLPQLKEILSGKWKDEPYMLEILKPVLVAAMKNKPSEEQSSDNDRQKNDPDSTDKIPEFIYNF